MAIWTQEYIKGAIRDEIALAAVHPKWGRRFTAPVSPTLETDLCQPARRGGNLLSAGGQRLAFSTQPKAPPRWRRNWKAAGELSTELGLSVRHDLEEGTVSAGNGSRRRDITESYADHPTKDAATWAAIVRAAIQVCTEARESH